MPTQNVNLTPELERFVKTQVSSGRFNSISEVHRAAISEMARHEQERGLRLQHLRQEIQKGMDDIEAGRYTAFHSESELDTFMQDTLLEVMAEPDTKQQR